MERKIIWKAYLFMALCFANCFSFGGGGDCGHEDPVNPADLTIVETEDAIDGRSVRWAAVANSRFDSVTLVDLNTFDYHNVSVGEYPQAIVSNGEAGWVATANRGSNDISLIHLSDFHVDTVVSGEEPFDILAQRNSSNLWVANRGDGSILVLDGFTYATETITGLSGVARLVQSESGKTIYALAPRFGELFVIDAESREIREVRQIGFLHSSLDLDFRTEMRVTADGRYLVIADAVDSRIHILDLQTGDASLIALPNFQPSFVSLLLDSETAFVSGRSDRWVWDEIEEDIVYFDRPGNNFNYFGRMFEVDLVTGRLGQEFVEAKGDVTRGLEVLEFACSIPHLLKGESLPNLAEHIDGTTTREPIGVCAGITPFNFPIMVPMWMAPLAIASGNTFILKPSEKVPLSANRLAEIFLEAGLPEGVFNVVHGSREAVETICDHPDINAVSFVGSTATAQAVYERATKSGKRVQAAGGAKNVMMVMPDAEMDSTLRAIMGAAFGCAGQRCMAGSILMGIGDIADPLKEQLVARNGRVEIGQTPRKDRKAGMGAVIDALVTGQTLRCHRQGLPVQDRDCSRRKRQHARSGLLRRADLVRQRERRSVRFRHGIVRTGALHVTPFLAPRGDRAGEPASLRQRRHYLHQQWFRGPGIHQKNPMRHGRHQRRRARAHGHLPLQRMGPIVLRRSARPGPGRCLLSIPGKRSCSPAGMTPMSATKDGKPQPINIHDLKLERSFVNPGGSAAPAMELPAQAKATQRQTCPPGHRHLHGRERPRHCPCQTAGVRRPDTSPSSPTSNPIQRTRTSWKDWKNCGESKAQIWLSDSAAAARWTPPRSSP